MPYFRARPAVGLLLALAFGGAAAGARGGEKPNVVLIVADDLGYGDLGCYGNKAIPTPHIDDLARQGVKFTDAYVTACTCSPSRAGLLSGCYQQRFGFEFNCNAAAARRQQQKVGLPPDVPTVADVLKKGGYATGMVGKWHVGFADHHHPLARGFDEFFGFLPSAHEYLAGGRGKNKGGEDGGARGEVYRDKTRVEEKEYLTDAFAREAVAFVEKNKAKPFFLYLPFNAVHTPLQAPAKYLDRFKDAKGEQRTFNAMTSALDDAVGRVLEALRKHDLEKNTLVVFLSDNGGPEYTRVQSNGPLRGGKLFLFEGGVRVPMLVKWPARLKGGTEFAGVTSALDLLPTLATASGSPLPKGLTPDGVDLLPWLEGKQTGSPHETLVWRNGPNHAVRRGNWKLVRAGEHVWLFDLSKDVGEKTNVADKHPDVVQELMAAFAEWEKGMKPPAWPSRSTRTVEIDGVKYEIHI